MRFANELKVGLALVVSAAIFILGLRYLKDIPLFSGTNAYYSVVAEANGLIGGNPVRIHGVKVGSVTDVRLDTNTDSIRVDFKIDRSIRIPSGSYATIAGIDALGGVRLDIRLGRRDSPPIGIGGLVPNLDQSGDLLSQLSDRAPRLADQADSVMTGLDATLTATSRMLTDPNSDVRRTLAALRGTATVLEGTLREEQAQIGQILDNVESITGSLKSVTDSEGDSLAIAVADLRQALSSLNDMMESLQQTTRRLDDITGKLDRGEGTLGKLLNDPGLYVQLDSAARNLNALLADFRRQPRRYLRELKIVDIF